MMPAFKEQSYKFCATVQKMIFFLKDGTNRLFHRLVSEETSSQTLLCILKAEYKMI